MNLGQAVAVCLYELVRDRGKKKGDRLRSGAERKESDRKKEDSASARELERVTSLLLDALRASEYLDDRPSAVKEEKLRRMVRRLNFTADDAEVWLGMLRQVAWKLKQR